MPDTELLRKLSWEDRDALRFARNVERGLSINADPRQVRGYAANVLENFLEPHFELEERCLIGRLNELERSHLSVTGVLQQHAQFGVLKRELWHTDETQSYALLTHFHQLLERHVHYEEKHFFPYIEICLDVDQLQQAQREIAAAQIVDCSSWPDPFWKAR